MPNVILQEAMRQASEATLSTQIRLDAKVGTPDAADVAQKSYQQKAAACETAYTTAGCCFCIQVQE